METRKISARIGEKLMASFQVQLDTLFIKRDAFLDHMIDSELDYLRSEMSGKKLSAKAKRHISKDVKRSGKLFNLTLRKTTADRLDAVIVESNMVRDAFLNRLIVLLRCGETIRDIWEVPKTVDGREFRGLEGIPVSPLEAMDELTVDPLYYLRNFMEARHGEGLYTAAGLPPAFCCYLDDRSVPGTEAHTELEASLLGPDDFEKKYLVNANRSAS